MLDIQPLLKYNIHTIEFEIPTDVVYAHLPFHNIGKRLSLVCAGQRVSLNDMLAKDLALKMVDKKMYVFFCFVFSW